MSAGQWVAWILGVPAYLAVAYAVARTWWTLEGRREAAWWAFLGLYWPGTIFLLLVEHGDVIFTWLFTRRLPRRTQDRRL